MLSYQHGYHAGGPADIHKHFALAGVLSLLTRKPRPITYMESHAGRGVYNLGGEQARKTGEWKAGIGKAERRDHPFWTAIDATRARYGATAYPGSPAVARALLRPQDRMVLMELHPTENAELREAMAGEVVEIHKRDGCEGLLALSPPDPRRGLVLIDPSYERKDDYDEIGDFAVKLAQKWPQAAIMIWYPILKAARHERLARALSSASPLRHEVRFPPHGGREGGMTGSGLLLLNAPFGSEKVMA